MKHIEDHDFKFDPWKYLEFEDYPDIQNKIRKQFKTAGILELLNELDHADENPIEEKEKQTATITALKRLIAIKLDLFDNEHGHFLVDTLPGYIEKNEETVKELEQTFKTHRHATDKLYSEKPSW